MQEEAVNDSLAENQAHETIQENEQPQENNGIRALRQSYEALKEQYRQKELEIAKKEAMLAAMQQMQAPAQAPVKQKTPLDYFEGMEDDDIAQVANVKKAMLDMYKELEELKKAPRSTGLTPVQQARLNYPDYDRVVSRETVEKYLYNPVLQETFQELKDKSPEKAYRYIKHEMELAAQRAQSQVTQQKVEESKTRLKSPNQVPVGLSANSYPQTRQERSDLRNTIMNDIKSFIRSSNAR